MKFGVSFANTGPFVRPEGALALARAAEEAGFESLWTVEHVVVPAGYESPYPYSRSGKMAGGMEDFEIPDPLVWLAFLASATERIHLATGVVVLPMRNPLILAKQVASLDVLSQGRFILGVGSGWLEEEFAALGVSFDDRGDRTDEYIRVLREVWGSEQPTFSGDYVSFPEVYSRPQPAGGSIPVVIGGHSRRAARRAGELGDGFFPVRAAGTDLVELMAHARRSAEAAGRDPDGIEMTAGSKPTDESVAQMQELGVDRVVVPLMDPASLRQFGTDVISRYA